MVSEHLFGKQKISNATLIILVMFSFFIPKIGGVFTTPMILLCCFPSVIPAICCMDLTLQLIRASARLNVK